MCRLPSSIGVATYDSRRVGDRIPIEVTGVYSGPSGYSAIHVGHLDIVSMNRHIIELEEQLESFEQLVAQLMLTVKSLTPK